MIEGDGVGYYSFLHAALVSHNLSFESEYAAAIASHTPLYLPWVTDRTAGGRLTDLYPAGSALLAVPAFVLALVIHPSGEPQYGAPFVEAFTLASLFFGLIALALAWRMAVVVVRSERAATIGLAACVFATPFAFYLLSDPSYSHNFSVFCIAAFVYAWWKGPPNSWRGWFGLGVLGGLMAMTRFQDGLLVLVLLIDFRRFSRRTIAFVPGVALGFAPQMAVDWIQYGALLPKPFSDQVLQPAIGHYFEVLFGSAHGLLVWTPVAAIALAGAFLIPDRRLRWACLLAFVVELALVGAISDDVGSAFGARRFLGLLPLWVVALAAVATRVRPSISWLAVALLAAWNYVLMANFEYVMNGANPTYSGLIRGQIEALKFTPRLLVKGAVVRDLVLYRQAHISSDVFGGLTLLVLEAACLGCAAAVALRRGRQAPRP